MKYSDWQLNRVRDALRAYHLYERSHDGEVFTWKDVSEAIDEYVGVKVPPERLRQFVEGVNTKDGGRKFPVPQVKSLEGIVSFVLNDELDLLRAEELEGGAPDMHAAQRLSEYLGPSQRDDIDKISPQSLIGLYRNSKIEGDEFAVRDLTLQNPSAEGFVQVVVSESFYSPDAKEQFESWSFQEWQDERYTHFNYTGWALMTPEVNLLFFLKEDAYKSNRYYVTVASDLSSADSSRANLLALFESDHPRLTKFDPLQGSLEKITETTGSQMVDRLYVFAREAW